jgi:hypothetical protein
MEHEKGVAYLIRNVGVIVVGRNGTNEPIIPDASSD